MTEVAAAGTFALGNRAVHRMGFGAMQLAGPHHRPCRLRPEPLQYRNPWR